jgi:hypothetical protein
MKFCEYFLLVWSLVLVSQAQTQSTPGDASSGALCVLPNSKEPPTRVSPGGEYNPATLAVKIDKRDAILWPHEHTVRIADLAIDGRHLIVLTSDGKRIQSLWFRFSDFKDSKLCVAYDGYEGVQLGGKKTALWCKCQ